MSISSQLNVQRHPARYVAFAALALAACSGDSPLAPAPQLELRYTEYGIPHIRSDSYESAGFGQGYAQARDNLCLIERGMVGFAGELSRYFGPDAAGSNMSSAGNGLNSDFYFRNLNDSRTIEDLLDQPIRT